MKEYYKQEYGQLHAQMFTKLQSCQKAYREKNATSVSQQKAKWYRSECRMGQSQAQGKS